MIINGVISGDINELNLLNRDLETFLKKEIDIKSIDILNDFNNILNQKISKLKNKLSEYNLYTNDDLYTRCFKESCVYIDKFIDENTKLFGKKLIDNKGWFSKNNKYESIINIIIKDLEKYKFYYKEHKTYSVSVVCLTRDRISFLLELNVNVVDEYNVNKLVPVQVFVHPNDDMKTLAVDEVRLTDEFNKDDNFRLKNDYRELKRLIIF